MNTFTTTAAQATTNTAPELEEDRRIRAEQDKEFQKSMEQDQRKVDSESFLSEICRKSKKK